jgi:uncharacterized protein with PIN domain
VSFPVGGRRAPRPRCASCGAVIPTREEAGARCERRRALDVWTCARCRVATWGKGGKGDDVAKKGSGAR